MNRALIAVPFCLTLLVFLGRGAYGAEHGKEDSAHSRSAPTSEADSGHGFLGAKPIPARVLTYQEEPPRQRPEACLQSGVFPCVVRTGERRRWLVKSGASRIHLSQNTILILQHDSSLPMELVQGQIWVEGVESLRVRTPFASVQAADSEFWISQEKGLKQTVVRALAGEVYVSPVGTKERILIPVAMENWFGPVDQSGRGTSGAPTPLNWTAQIREWASLYGDGGNAFNKRVKQLASVWNEVIEQSVAIHKGLAERYIASERQKQERQARVREHFMREQRALRKMFRERNYLVDSE